MNANEKKYAVKRLNDMRVKVTTFDPSCPATKYSHTELRNLVIAGKATVKANISALNLKFSVHIGCFFIADDELAEYTKFLQARTLYNAESAVLARKLLSTELDVALESATDSIMLGNDGASAIETFKNTLANLVQA